MKWIVECYGDCGDYLPQEFNTKAEAMKYWKEVYDEYKENPAIEKYTSRNYVSFEICDDGFYAACVLQFKPKTKAEKIKYLLDKIDTGISEYACALSDTCVIRDPLEELKKLIVKE